MGKNVIISTLPNISQNYLPKVNTSNIFANSLVYDNGTNVMVNTTATHADYTNARLVVNNTGNSYLEVRGNGGQGTIALTTSTSTTSNFPTVEIFNSADFGIVGYRPGVVSSNYIMYYELSSSTNRRLTFQTEGVTRLAIQGAGRILMGPTLPTDDGSTALQVNGGGKFSSSVTANGISSIGQEQAFTFQRTTGTASDVYSFNADSSGAYLYNNTTSKVLTYWREGGDVGIGTDLPDRRLHVYNNTSTTTPLVKFENAGTGDAVTEYRITGYSWYVGIDNSASGSFKIGQDPLGTSDRLVIKDGGQVGIRITPNSGWGSAMSVLQVGTGGVLSNWTGANNNLTVGVNFYDNGAGSQLRLYTGAASTIGFSGDVITFSNAASDSAGAAITFNPRMTITSGGMVNINNTGNTTHRLYVSGNIYSTDTVFGRNLQGVDWASVSAGSPSATTVPAGYSTMTFSIGCDNTWRTILSQINDTKAYFWAVGGDQASQNLGTWSFQMTSPAYGVANFVNVHYMSGGWNAGSIDFQYVNQGNGVYGLQVKATSYYSSSNVATGRIYFLRLG